MKNVVLAIAAVLALIALPAAAQYETSAPATTTEPAATTPSTGLTSTQNPTEVRTNAAVPTHSNDPGLTASGKVESWDDGEVVLKTSTGSTHFKLLPSTVGSRTFTVGQSLSIDFSRNEQGVLLAKQIRDAAPMATTTTTTGAAQAGAAVEEAVENVGEAIEEGVEETAGSDLDNDGAIGTRGAPTGMDSTASTTTTTVDTPAVDTTTSLPATGSNSPLLGLLGLLALGGAAAVRRL